MEKCHRLYALIAAALLVLVCGCSAAVADDAATKDEGSAAPATETAAPAAERWTLSDDERENILAKCGLTNADAEELAHYTVAAPILNYEIQADGTAWDYPIRYYRIYKDGNLDSVVSCIHDDPNTDQLMWFGVGIPEWAKEVESKQAAGTTALAFVSFQDGDYYWDGTDCTQYAERTFEGEPYLDDWYISYEGYDLGELGSLELTDLTNVVPLG